MRTPAIINLLNPTLLNVVIIVFVIPNLTIKYALNSFSICFKAFIRTFLKTRLKQFYTHFLL